MCVRVTGNLFRTADGRLAYIDFGMMGEIEPDVRRCPRSLEFGQKMWLVAQ
jgi:predicted unusual protein kinase regulating ubiquinone biosynthesis (AarF/ABC1/UbiB family)